MALKKVRTSVVHFYEDGGHYFKVWEASGAGWWVDEVTELGEHINTHALEDTVALAEAAITKHLNQLVQN